MWVGVGYSVSIVRRGRVVRVVLYRFVFSFLEGVAVLRRECGYCVFLF